MEYVCKLSETFEPLRFFEEISRIPRVSYHEEAIAEYLIDFAVNRGLEHYTDAIHNVIIKKPGSAGYELHPPVMLQGHTDMIGAKKPGSAHNFDTDPIKLICEGNILRANGTTLGADDGVAVAYMLALLNASDMAHPPLECVFTAQEEVGLNGAKVLDCSILEAKRMLNMDAGPEGVFIISCAGGLGVTLERTYTTTSCPENAVCFAIEVSGLSGGHSGTEIGLEKGNAIQIIGRVLNGIRENAFLVSVNGGEKSNIIPRNASAEIVTDNATTFKEVFQNLAEEIKTEFPNEPELLIQYTEKVRPASIPESDCAADILNLLQLLPTGTLSRSIAMGIPVLSSNLAIITMGDGVIKILNSIRSDLKSRKYSQRAKLQTLAGLNGFICQSNEEYPGWPAGKKSPLLDTIMQVYTEVTGAEAKTEGIHAGLECGIFADKIPGLEIVAFGPEYKLMHTTEEWLNLDSFCRTWDVLVNTLKKL